MRQRSRKGRAAGFTLVEVVFVLGVAAVLLLGVFSTMTTSIKARNFVREREIAREAARTKLELIQDLAASGQLTSVPGLHNTRFPVPDPADFAGTGVTLDPKSTLSSPVAGQDPGLIVVENVLDSGGVAIPDLYRVTVRVDWRSAGAGANNNSVEVGTFVANRRGT